MRLRISKMLCFRFLCCLVVLVPAADIAANQLRVANIFGDNMVLQRDVEVPVWGWANAADEITVLARDQKIAARADGTGKWMARLRPMVPGDPFAITISGPDNTVELKNVVVGEVWICSGQSNMEWPVVASANAKDEIAAADFPMIRHVKVTHQIAMSPQAEAGNSGWQVCSPETAGNFTAVGYYFGRKLHKELGIPVGLINSSWGGTIVEAWTSADSLQTHPDFTNRIKQIQSNASNLKEATKQFEGELATWQRNHESAIQATDHFAKIQFDDSDWKQIEAPGNWEGQGYDSFDGIAWYRRSINIPDSWVGKDLSLSLAQIDDNDRTFVNGELVGSTRGYNSVRQYRISSEINNADDMTIAVQVHDTRGAGGIHGQDSQLSISNGNSDRISLAGTWKFNTTELASKLPERPQPPGFREPNNPTALFNAMINPLIPCSFRGAIWYQGESNASRAHQYRSLFPLLIEDWRARWHRQLPFYWVQLANFRSSVDAPQASSWAELREAQSMALKLPATGEAVIIDIGDAKDIHPRNKQDVGLRLALHALKKNYGVDVQFSGPRYRELTVEGSTIRLKFDFADGIKSSDGKPLTQFAVAGSDQKFVWASAELDGNDVIVSSSKVENPIAVRYAWADNPAGCNLTNRSGLPASPFRTDSWPGVTVDKK